MDPLRGRGRGRGRGGVLRPPGSRPPPPPGRPGQAGRGRATIPPQPLDARSQHSNVTTLTERMREFEGLSGSSPETTQAASSDLSTTNPSGPLFYDSSKDFRGTTGKELPVSSNFLELEIDRDMGLFEFEVKFNPIVDSRHERFSLINQLKPEMPVRSFDGVKLYLPKVPDKLDYEVANQASGSKVSITLVLKSTTTISDDKAIQFYNVLITKLFRLLKFTPHRRNFYDAEGKVNVSQHGLQIWPGYVTAVDKYKDRGLLLQIDVHHRVLRTETARDVFINLKTKPNFKDEVEKAMMGTSVLTRYNNKTYQVDSVDWEATPKSTFVNSKGEEMSYLDYYKKQYQLDIRDPDQPMLVSRVKKKAVEERDVEMLVYLVPEFCLLTGMTDNMRADFRVMQDVAKITRVSPEQRRAEIGNFLKRIHASPEAKELLQNWGLSLSKEPIGNVMARVLPPEKLFFGKGYSEMVGPRADWGRASTTKPCLTAVAIHKWAILFPERCSKETQKFFAAMQQSAPKMGIDMAMPKRVVLPNDRNDTYVQKLNELIDPSVQLVMCIVPQLRSDRYAAIKKVCCLEKPVASQVIVSRTISNEKRLQAVAQKVVLQMNCKLGGELWGCQTPFKNLMVLGIDIFHETKDKSTKAPSIAGFVSTLNPSLSRFYSGVYRNKKGQEITNSLKTAFADSLMQYHDVNNCFPDKIVVFRDGVGDGDLLAVLNHEIPQLLSTFESIKSDKAEGYKPGFNYVVVQKRINTKIFAFAGKDPQGKWENPPPGTVLDHSVVRSKAIADYVQGKAVAFKEYKDFYLVPQSVNQGTVSPSHFVCVDEKNECLDVNNIQKLAYQLTHMYFNWPGTVRVPAPVQYAHKLVNLIGESVRDVPSSALAKTLYYL